MGLDPITGLGDLLLIGTDHFRDGPSALGIGGRQARDEGLPCAQFLEVSGGHQGGIGDIDEGLLTDSKLGLVLADLGQDGVVDLFVGAIAVFFLAEYGNLITYTQVLWCTLF